MSSKTYDIHGDHCWVTVSLASVSPGYGLPQPIVLVTGDRVWVQADHSMIGGEAVQVGDGLSNGFDQQGGCIASVPISLCTFHTDAEAEVIVACMDADAELLGYAL